ncbi:D-alanine--D-alanine ligase [Gordonia sp. HY285]|uniref:D-alanine--D-alanine ligase family protein n=1 Tax=Gordonia liuliyuniae TaxID=2911517 RepID=UPI001F028933|nr:D-alanine--D-alanine ligase [Gordonia liuliyuniae]MCF8609214.1 D-alanine--D-alanine ligase [Gordonia liuliyuniae]
MIKQPETAQYRVAVIGGGANCEHDVSIASAAAVVAALESFGHQAIPFTIDPSGQWRAGRRQIDFGTAVTMLRDCDVVFPALHGPRGEDGTVAGLCELVGVPYVGSGVGAGALAMDKWATKLVAGAVGIATAPATLLTESTAASYAFSQPVVVKPLSAGSSFGVGLARTPVELATALADAFEFGDRVLVEDVVVGREIDVAVLGRPDGSRLVAPALEIIVEELFSHADKYGGAAGFRVPAEIEDADRIALADAAVAMYDALGCCGLARIDYFLTDEGPVLNEVNTMPGFTEQSQAPKMFAAAGTGYPDLVNLLVSDAIAGE